MGLFIRAVTDAGVPLDPGVKGETGRGIGQGLPVHPTAEDGPELRVGFFPP